MQTISSGGMLRCGFPEQEIHACRGAFTTPKPPAVNGRNMMSISPRLFAAAWSKIVCRQIRHAFLSQDPLVCSDTSETEAAIPSIPLLKSIPISLPRAVRMRMGTALRCMPVMT